MQILQLWRYIDDGGLDEYLIVSARLKHTVIQPSSVCEVPFETQIRVVS